MQYQTNLKGESAPLIFIIVIVILIIGGLLYFTAQAPKETPSDVSLGAEVMPVDLEQELPAEETVMGEDEEEAEMMPAPASEEKKETTPSEKKEVGGPSVKSFDITGKNFAFSQTVIRVKKGDKVRINFTNTDGSHDWTVDEFNAASKQVNTGGSASVEFTADKAGTFEYYCSVGNHRQLGMKGNLIVE